MFVCEEMENLNRQPTGTIVDLKDYNTKIEVESVGVNKGSQRNGVSFHKLKMMKMI